MSEGDPDGSHSRGKRRVGGLRQSAVAANRERVDRTVNVRGIKEVSWSHGEASGLTDNTTQREWRAGDGNECAARTIDRKSGYRVVLAVGGVQKQIPSRCQSEADGGPQCGNRSAQGASAAIHGITRELTALRGGEEEQRSNAGVGRRRRATGAATDSASLLVSVATCQQERQGQEGNQ